MPPYMPRHPKRKDELGDSFPNDPLEQAILVVVLFCLMGGGAFMYYLGTKA